ncbi:MAG: SsrA-binding protein SmpB [Erysipelotrichaceae bacterium]|nr:SsrA-binding protein SmpB [Erysipelotrichaceae bacterium]
MEVISENRQARHDYFLEDFFECGLVLKGTEIKSVRDHKVNLKDSYVLIRNGEAFLLNAHISIYKEGNIFNHEESRTRKLLLHKKEILKLKSKVEEKGYTLVPTKMYLLNGKAKLEVALAKGKHTFDKRQTEKERDLKREIAKSMKY